MCFNPVFEIGTHLPVYNETNQTTLRLQYLIDSLRVAGIICLAFAISKKKNMPVAKVPNLAEPKMFHKCFFSVEYVCIGSQ